MKKNPIIETAKLILQERELSKRARAMRDQIIKYTQGGYYTSCSLDVSTDAGALTIAVTMAVYEAARGDLEAPPKLETYDDVNGNKYGRLRYPSLNVGQVGARPVLINTCSEGFAMPAEAQTKAA